MVKRGPSKTRRFVWQSAAARRLLALAGDARTIGEAVEMVAGRFLKDIFCPPTSLKELQAKLCVAGPDIDDIPFSAELRQEGKSFRIILSKYLAPSRHRFTTAHELAHAILETSGPRCPRHGSELERLCDMLATELLMPRAIFETSLGAILTMGKIREMAKLFDTSLTSTVIRAAELRRCTAFAVEGNAVSWARGSIRKGSINTLQDDLARAVRKSAESPTGEDILNLSNRSWTGDWKVEWITLGADRRRLFILQPSKIPQNKQASA
ncbi:MAG TPA: ImmA/IrrE family metallo-endopeptidase [Candidatus Dormibacteraeota bacterium]|nr:ImmA/IrrE family metallo-endopeptidase [Candidatus Dormibacteraeota bacterium]